MPVPASYTEETLAAFLHASIGGTAEALGWSVVAGSYDLPVTRALMDYGESDISAITGLANLAKLQALALVRVWESVVMSTAADFDFKVDGGQYNRSQIHNQAKQALATAKAAAMPYDPAWSVQVGAISYPDDPYKHREELIDE